MSKKLLSLILTLVLISCSNDNSNFEVEQLISNESIFITKNIDGEFSKLKIPLSYKVKNKSKTNKISFSSISHKDFLTASMSPSILYEVIEDSLVVVSKAKYKSIEPLQEKKYVLYIQHNLDSIDRKNLNYLKENNLNNKIEIKNVDFFKKKHKKLLNQLLKGDSIHIRSKSNDRIKKLKYPITIY